MLWNLDNRAGKHARSLSELYCQATLHGVLPLGGGCLTVWG